ncbi:hypothetical protein P167DRAFT_580218 [Morchella conica CCBAS932]|uniref:Uncharacterized protein n=1 Tax=Morchella conica CCBAS932 TaxID=1392247 RepID=A0A3N4KBG4_9PEZI|nr:hypothetical protein P167DRAFT_580218 [Morchella conica CCBAS932]
MPWSLHSPFLNPRDTDTPCSPPLYTATTPSPLSTPREPEDDGFFGYISPVDPSPSPPRPPLRSPTPPPPPPPPRPRHRRRNTRRRERLPEQEELSERARSLLDATRVEWRRGQRGVRRGGGDVSIVTREEVRGQAETPPLPLSTVVDRTSVHGRRGQSQRRTSDAAGEGELAVSHPPRRSADGRRRTERVRDPSPEMDDYNGVMTRMPSPDVTWPPPRLPVPRMLLAGTVMERDMEATAPRRQRAPSPDVYDPFPVPWPESGPYEGFRSAFWLDGDDGIMTRMPSPVMTPFPGTRASVVTVPPQQRETELYLSSPRWLGPLDFTPPPVTPSRWPVLESPNPNTNPEPKAESEPITKQESEPEPEPEPELELTLPATAALLESVASDLVAGTRRLAWRRIERALGALRDLHIAGAGAGAGSSDAGERECVVSEQVGGGPSGKWPVVFCPVAHCGAVVETAVKVFRG